MAIFSLKNQKEFDLVNKYGSKRHGSCFILVLATNFTHIISPTQSPTFFGMKVSRKLSKKAVVRNKVKRRIRHLVRHIVKTPTIDTSNTAFIIIPKKGFDKVSFVKLTADFYSTFAKALS